MESMETKEGAKGHSFVPLLCPCQFDFRALSKSTELLGSIGGSR
jgi:hypothetical protein